MHGGTYASYNTGSGRRITFVTCEARLSYLFGSTTVLCLPKAPYTLATKSARPYWRQSRSRFCRQCVRGLMKPVSMSVCPQDVFLISTIFGICRPVTHYGMPYDPTQGQGQGHGGQKDCENIRFQSLSPAAMDIIKRLLVNYDTRRQYLTFNF